MAKAEPPVSDVFVGNQSAYVYLGGAEIHVFPGMLVHRDSAILKSRPALFDELVLAVEGMEDVAGTAAVVTVLAVSKSGDLGHGGEMVRVRRLRTRPPAELLST